MEGFLRKGHYIVIREARFVQEMIFMGHKTLYTITFPPYSNLGLVRASARSAVVQSLAACLVGVHAVGALVASIVSHSVVRAVEAQTGDAGVALDAGSLLKTSGKVVGDLTEDTNLALDDLLNSAVAHVATDVADEALASTLVPDLLPQGAGSVEVFGTDFAKEADSLADEVAVNLAEVDGALAEGDGLNRAEVCRARTLVVEGHVAITLEVGGAVGSAGGIGGELLVVGANAVAVGVGVREETGLQDRVGRGLNTRNHVSGVEGDLLDLGEVVLCVLVEEELSDLAQRELLVGPDVGQVEDIDPLLLPQVLSFLGSHGLEADIPAGEVTSLDGVVQVLLRVVGAVVGRVFLGDERCALLALHVHLCVYPLAVLVDELKSVAGVTVHLPPAVGDTAVTHEDHDLVDGLGVLRKVVPEHGGVVGVGKVSGRVTLLGVNEVRELRGVAEEEDGSVVGNHVPVALISPELDTEATRVAGQVRSTTLTADGREADTDGALLALGGEHVCHAEVIERIGCPVETVGTTTLGVDDTLGNTLAVEVRKQIDQVVVLEEKRAVLAGTLCLVRVGHGNAIGSGVEGVLRLGVAVVAVIDC